MKIFRFIAPLLLCGLTLMTGPGCAPAAKALPEGNVMLPEIDVVAVKENADEAIKISQEAKVDVEMLKAKMTEVNNQLLSFSEEMASVSAAKVEELENRVALLTEEAKNLYREIDSLRKTQRLAPRTAKPAVFELPTFRPGSDEANAKLSPEERKYRKAQSFFNANQFLNAVVAFKEALKASPDGKWADNCQYWIGESYFKMDQYAYAIAAYKKVFSYTQTDKADDAQMRIGQAYAKLGDAAQAAVEFKNLLQNYPQSQYVDEAKKLIHQLE